MVKLKDLKYHLTITPILTPIIEESNKEVTPFNLRGNIKIINKSEKSRIIAGYANIAVVDLEDQFIPIETLKKGIESLLKDPHYSNLMLVHQNIQIGKIISEYGELTTHVDDKGLFIVAEIRNDIKTADKIWESILDGEINGFSIGCEVIRDHQKCDEKKCVTILDEINIFEVSVCTKPVNEESGFVVVSKSQLNDNVCNECIKNIDKMTKTKNKTESEVVKEEEKEVKETPKKETKEETKQEEPEEDMPEEDPEEEPEEEVEEWKKSYEDRLSNIERSISSLTEIIQGLAKPKEEEIEEPEEEEKSEETPSEEPSDSQKSEEENKTEESEEDTSKLSEKDYFDELKNSVDDLKKSVNSLLEKEELKLSIKARDDQINALKEKLKVLDEPKGESKTVQEEESKDLNLEHDHSFIVRRGEVYIKD